MRELVDFEAELTVASKGAAPKSSPRQALGYSDVQIASAWNQAAGASPDSARAAGNQAGLQTRRHLRRGV